MWRAGIADALLIGEQFVGSDDVCLVLGDNIFYSPDFECYLDKALSLGGGACVFGYYVDDPRAFGVVEFDEQGRAVSIEESRATPSQIISSPACISMTMTSWRSRTTSNPRRAASSRSRTSIWNTCAAASCTWSSSTETLSGWTRARRKTCMDSAQEVKRVQDETGRYIACLEEIAYQRGYISHHTLMRHAADLNKTLYGRYLECL